MATVKKSGLVIKEAVTLDAMLVPKDSVTITIFHDRELTSLFLYNELEQWKSVVKEMSPLYKEDTSTLIEGRL